jgi:hypothetical protein
MEKFDRSFDPALRHELTEANFQLQPNGIKQQWDADYYFL